MGNIVIWKTDLEDARKFYELAMEIYDMVKNFLGSYPE